LNTQSTALVMSDKLATTERKTKITEYAKTHTKTNFDTNWPEFRK